MSHIFSPTHICVHEVSHHISVRMNTFACCFPSFSDSTVQTQVEPHVLTGLRPQLGGREATGMQAKRETELMRERTPVSFYGVSQSGVSPRFRYTPVLFPQRPSPEPARRQCVSLRVSDRFLVLKSRSACCEAAMSSAVMLFSGLRRQPVRLRIVTAGSACQLAALA